MQCRVAIVACLALAAISARGDVIHLKNGKTIWAESVREKGSQIEYDIGDNSYAIPKSLVERVDAGGTPPAYPSSAANSELKSGAELQSFTSSTTLKGEDDLASQIVKQSHVDSEALETIAAKSGPDVSAAAYFIAGKQEFEHGDLGKARRYFDTALGFQPNNSTILNYYAALLVRTGNPQQALTYAARSAKAAPDSPDAYTVLGFAQFSSNHTSDAIRSWKKSLELRPDPRVEELMAKAERESKAEAQFSERESSHFTLRFEGSQTSESLRREILGTLESHYDDLVRELGISPRASIQVVLYTNQAFFDVTHAPSWSGALNDGKLRIPVNGLNSVTPDLARVLKHELAHSFVNQASGGRCPTWLHEGIAQFVEPKTLDANGRRLAQLFSVQQQIPFNVLEGSFIRLSSGEAVLAYDESLAAVTYISETYGMSDIQRILERLSQGSSAEAALRATIHSDYGDLGAEVGKFLVSRYGR
jgi:tetratricopeptide (TPR) repeat protein